MNVKDENGNNLIGYVDLGTHLMPRAELARVLPDINRFERCLADALAVDEYMTDHNGAVPVHLLDSWGSAYRGDVISTLRELGALDLAAADELESCDHEPPEAA